MQNDLLAPPTAHRGSGCPDLTSSTASPSVCGPDFQKLLLEKKSKTPSEASLTSELDSQNWPHCPPCGSRESEAMADGKSVLWTIPNLPIDLNKLLPLPPNTPSTTTTTINWFGFEWKKHLEFSVSCVFLWFCPVSQRFRCERRSREPYLGPMGVASITLTVGSFIVSYLI